jgi:hypothetical protein
MELIENGKVVSLEVEEWINQPAARGTLRLCVGGADGTKESIYDWMFQTDADLPYIFRLPALFPWADLSVDGEFYRSRGASGDEEESEAPPVRPWSVEAGEIARFLLRLSLNELGRSFLTAERFLRRGEFPRSPAGSVKGKIGELYENGLKCRLYKKN